MHICTQQGGRICWDCAENYGILPDTTLWEKVSPSKSGTSNTTEE